MKFATHALAAILTAVLILLPAARKIPRLSRTVAVVELMNTRRAVEKRINDMSHNLAQQLSALGNVISNDRDFSMKVLVEGDKAAPEVADIAARHMAPMGLSILDITDEQYTILSSGHFTARAGVNDAKKAEILSDKPLFIMDNVIGRQALTLQAKVGFQCADFQFYCVGGYTIDSSFLALCTPRDDIRILLKRGKSVSGMDGIETISEIKKHTLIVNDKSYLAAAVSLPTVEGDIEITELIILMPEPEKASLLSLFK